MDARTLRRSHCDARARLGHRHDSRRRRRLARIVGTLRPAPVRRSVRAGDPLCARRLRRIADHRGKMGAGGRRDAEGPRLVRALRAARPAAGGGRDLREPGDGGLAGEDRAVRRRRFLSRRAGRRDGASCAGILRCAHARRLRRAHRRLGHPARLRLSRHDGPRDSAQRPRHLGVDGARDPRELRPRRAGCGLRGRAASGDRGDEARVRRCVPLRERRRAR